VVPNKVFQGAAAGCAIVTSDTPPQRRAFGDAAIYVPPGDARALADVLVTLAADDAEVARARKVAADLARRAWHPEQAVQPLVDRLSAMAS
jgi:glycosyltransferase involved in cell wall biosynthesis